MFILHRAELNFRTKMLVHMPITGFSTRLLIIESASEFKGCHVDIVPQYVEFKWNDARGDSCIMLWVQTVWTKSLHQRML